MTVTAMGFEDFMIDMQEKYPNKDFMEMRFFMLMAYVQGSNDDMTHEQGLQFAGIPTHINKE